MKELKDIVVDETKPKGWFKCDKPKCNRTFGSIQALRMHQVRMHTRAGLRGAKLGVKVSAKLREAARQRYLEGKKAANKRARERFWAQGLTSAGTIPKQPLRHPAKPYSQSAEAKKKYYHAQKERYAAQGLNAHGKPRRHRMEPIVYRHKPD